MISNTLISTSEGQAKLVLWAVIIVGMFQGQIDWNVGIGIIAGEQAIWTGSRSYKKASESRSEALKADALAEAAESLRNRNGNR